MHRLKELGFKAEYNSYETYFKEIRNFQILVHKHVEEVKWTVTLIEHHEERDSEEIEVNDNATFEWVCMLVKVLTGVEI